VRYTCTAIECLAHSRKRKILFRRRSYEHGAIVKVSSVGPVPGHGCIESQRTLASTRSGGVLVGCHRSTPSRKLPDCNPYPDRLLGEIAPSDTEPDAVVVARETIELAFIAAIQLLSPWQRAVLILRDVLNWSARRLHRFLTRSPRSTARSSGHGRHCTNNRPRTDPNCPPQIYARRNGIWSNGLSPRTSEAMRRG
jgi:hypothetical protein